MWTERRKRIGPGGLPGPIAARKKAGAPASAKNRAAAPAGQKKWNVPSGQAPARQDTLKPDGIPDAGLAEQTNLPGWPGPRAAGKEEHHVD